MASESDLRDAYATMRAAFPAWATKQDRQSVRLWGDMLGDVPGDALVSAVRALAVSCEFAPTVARIREAAGCVDPQTAARREASREAAQRHAAWVAEQERLATEQARERLERSGIDPDRMPRVPISELTKRIGR